MPLPFRPLVDRLRGRLGRSMRSAGAWVETRDAATLAGRLDKGEIVWRAFVDAGTALRRCSRFDDADRMLERGLGAFPGDATLLYEHALCAHDSGRYELAIERWEKAIAQARGLAADRLAMCRSGLAANLRELGHLDRARETIAQARRLHPEDLVVLSEAARIADGGGEHAEALALWQTLLRAPEPPLEWIRGEIVSLIRLDRLDEAAHALRAAQDRHPQAPGLLVPAGLLAMAGGDRPGSIAIWTRYLEHYPDDPAGQQHLSAAVQAAGLPASGAAAPANARRAAADLLGRFEGIGEGPEFAAVQRRCGVDPDSLLATATLTLDALVSALDARFEGLGDPANSRLLPGPRGGGILRVRRWPIDIAVADDAAPADARGQAEEAALAIACRRVAAGRQRLLADLAAASKIVVFRSDGIDADSLERLHRALAAYGPIRLLSVQPAATTAPTLFDGRAGDVIRVATNRFVGFLERPGGSDEPAVADWIALCRKTLDIA